MYPMIWDIDPPPNPGDPQDGQHHRDWTPNKLIFMSYLTLRVLRFQSDLIYCRIVIIIG